MIDNIKIRFTLKGKRKSFGEAKSMRGGTIYSRNYEIAPNKPSPEIERTESEKKDAERKSKKLTMQVSYYPDNKMVIDIVGSWRQWYFGSSSTRDMNFSDALNCIKAIAEKIDVPVLKLMNAKILMVELGFNIRFKENMGGIINAFVNYKGFDPAYEFNRESIKFKGSAYSVAFYDKYSEIMQKKESMKKEEESIMRMRGNYPEKRNSKEKLAKKLNKNNFDLRFEVRVSEVSKCPPELKLGKKIVIDTPKKIFGNWNTILNGLSKMIDNTGFSEYNLNVGLDYLNGKLIKDLELYKTHLAAIAMGGARNYDMLIRKRLKSNHGDAVMKKEFETLNNPPSDLARALKKCRNKKSLFFETKNKRIGELEKRGNITSA